MSESSGLRFDKYLWSVRLYKTRSLATEACKNGRILLNGQPVKPSKIIEINTQFTLRRPPAQLSFRVISLPPSRVSAKLVSNYLEDLTTIEERTKLEVSKLSNDGRRVRGAGRPTKKDRRNLDEMRNSDS
jgi:ribosome-associated heat shock protein Hsp15